MTYRIPPQRVEAVGRLFETIGRAGRIVLTTHLNADGDVNNDDRVTWVNDLKGT